MPEAGLIYDKFCCLGFRSPCPRLTTSCRSAFVSVTHAVRSFHSLRATDREARVQGNGTRDHGGREDEW